MSGERGAGSAGVPHPRDGGRVSDPWDVLVVGGGPAGSYSALRAAQAGLRTLLVERVSFPRWKVCGASLNQAAQDVLRQEGLQDVPAQGVPLSGLQLHGWGRSVAVPLQGTVALRRSVMDQALLQAAQAAGTEILQGAVPDLGHLHRGHGLREVTVRRPEGPLSVAARVVVDATGLGALSEEGARSRSRVAEGSRIGVGAAFTPDARHYEPGCIHMVAGAAGYVGLVRTEDGGLNVAGALDPAFVRTQGGPGEAVAAHLAAAGMPPLPDVPLCGWRGTPALTRRPASRAGARWFRVGDSGGYVEPFTGEGMAWALAGARDLAPLVAEAVGAWDPRLASGWGRRYARSIGPRQRICRGIAWLSRRPGLARPALGALERAPWLAAPLARGTTRSYRPPLPSRRRGSPGHPPPSRAGQVP